MGPRLAALKFSYEGLQFLLHGQVLGDDRVGQIAAGTGLVQQVDEIGRAHV